MPHSIKLAVVVGMGLLLSFIGLQVGGWVGSPRRFPPPLSKPRTTCKPRARPLAPPAQAAHIVVPDPETMVTMGGLLHLEPLLAIAGLAVIAALHYRNVPGSILVGAAATATAYCAAKHTWPSAVVALPRFQYFPPDFSDLVGPGASAAAWSAVLAYTLVMVF